MVRGGGWVVFHGRAMTIGTFDAATRARRIAVAGVCRYQVVVQFDTTLRSAASERARAAINGRLGLRIYSGPRRQRQAR